MNFKSIVDVLIVLGILLYGIVGMKKGGIKQIVSTVGFVIVLVLAFKLKNPLAEFLSLHLPFFKFGGIYEGVTALNILIYQLIAFLIVVALLETVLNVIISISGILEKILKMTIILSIPSKILGFIVGLVEGFLIAFVILLILNQPMFNIKAFDESKLTNKILKSTPVMSSFANGIVDAVNDIYVVGKGNTEEEAVNDLNKNTVEIMLKHKLITSSYVKKLIDAGKIDIYGIEPILNKYQ